MHNEARIGSKVKVTATYEELCIAANPGYKEDVVKRLVAVGAKELRSPQVAMGGIYYVVAVYGVRHVSLSKQPNTPSRQAIACVGTNLLTVLEY